MKVDISKKIVTLNNDKLSEEINKFECLTNQTSYLFMNENTMKALSIATLPYADPSVFEESILCKYSGRKVYKNDDLEFGEVEIR